MARKVGTTKPWQFNLTTLLLVVLSTALLCANVVPRRQQAETEPRTVSVRRGFPFTYAEDVASSAGSYGTRNFAALTGNILVAGFVVALFFGGRRWRQRRASLAVP